MNRICIAGVPRAGKTYLAAVVGKRIALKPRSTDDLIKTHAWSDASAEVARWLDLSTYVIEGVAVGRALRKWMAANAGKPCDAVVWMPVPRDELTKGQAAMAKGCITVWTEILPELVARGVLVLDANEMAKTVRAA